MELDEPTPLEDIRADIESAALLDYYNEQLDKEQSWES